MPDNVRDAFDQIPQFLKWDLRAIIDADHGGNYAAALLVAVGCEALSRVLDRPKNFFLARLFTKHGLPPEIAQEVADALRNGVAHIYDTLYIEAGDLRLELIVSWGARPHLTVRRNPPGLYLNVRTMREDVLELFGYLRGTLPPGGELPRRWLEESVHPVDPRHIRLWREWFTNAKEGPEETAG